VDSTILTAHLATAPKDMPEKVVSVDVTCDGYADRFAPPTPGYSGVPFALIRAGGCTTAPGMLITAGTINQSSSAYSGDSGQAIQGFRTVGGRVAADGSEHAIP
jgi:hypothetical protein